jgi:hypothetical protein
MNAALTASDARKRAELLLNETLQSFDQALRDGDALAAMRHRQQIKLLRLRIDEAADIEASVNRRFRATQETPETGRHRTRAPVNRDVITRSATGTRRPSAASKQGAFLEIPDANFTEH